MSNIFPMDAKFWSSLIADPWTIMVNLLDILIVSWLIYRFIKTLAGTKIMSLVQGILLFLFLRFVTELIGFPTLTWLMNQILTYSVIALVVIFAPEIRSGLERFGRAPNVLIQQNVASDEEQMIAAFVKAVAYMSPRKIGALISVEQTQTLQEYVATGIPLNAEITHQLLINIFIPNTPLHDGAVIVRGKEIVSACSYLPLSESTRISKEFGTRHRAAIGLSELSDAFTIIVSEETGDISVAHLGEFYHDLSLEGFEKLLRKTFIRETAPSKVGFWSRLGGGRHV
ncbi:diadenylate cyclase CdaA [Streptococcus cuniculipharyngis]|uniref:Diadenylate cyclase n=1 Tax=Streptococcus cuniculipharyngis TaxID=1562651 RepID=A0A5C5SFN8_9STRE|nr:diadenylate cyclase CdaA [Streptococcus cuniculipharyngis]TWS98948.1 TIGR00159 family protein [Streptococcus cuniculipharyngis]